MKTIFKLLSLVLTIQLSSVLFYGCAASKNQTEGPTSETDLVCGMKVVKADAYKYKYDGKKYYFDSYNCKESFKMNPRKFIDKACK